jgi:hypothetical protein
VSHGNSGRNPEDFRLLMKTITRPADGWKVARGESKRTAKTYPESYKVASPATVLDGQVGLIRNVAFEQISYFLARAPLNTEHPLCAKAMMSNVPQRENLISAFQNSAVYCECRYVKEGKSRSISMPRILLLPLYY